MNERIKLLAEQARQYAFAKVENSQDPTEWSTKYYNEMFEQKFAELIVRECAEIGDNYQDILGNEPECANCRKVAYGIVDKIKQHFGVEE